MLTNAIIITFHFLCSAHAIALTANVSLTMERAKGLKADYPFYHSAADIEGKVARLQSACKGAMHVDDVPVEGTDQSIQFVTINAGQGRANRVLVAAGEHPRELIGPEAVLYFLRSICGDPGARLPTSFAGTDMLSDNEFMIVLNANPVSRIAVENGDYCVRANGNQVDLNRNYDTHWRQITPRVAGEGSAGEKPFSEPESRILKAAMEQFKPTLYLSVHSGTLGLYMPWAYDTTAGKPSKNQESMMSVIKNIDDDYCGSCPFGAAGLKVGYSAPGTSIDYAFDKGGAAFSFAYEIWSDDTAGVQEAWKKITYSSLMLFQEGAGAKSGHGIRHLSDSRYASFFKQFPSDFVDFLELESQPKTSNTDCFQKFNPGDEKSFNLAIKTWAAAFASTTQQVADILLSQTQ